MKRSENKKHRALKANGFQAKQRKNNVKELANKPDKDRGGVRFRFKVHALHFSYFGLGLEVVKWLIHYVV